MSSTVEVVGARDGSFVEVMTPEAMEFVAELHRHFDARRRNLLRDRVTRQVSLDHGEVPDFLTAEGEAQLPVTCVPS